MTAPEQSVLYAEVGTDWITRLGLQLTTTREILDRRLLHTTASVPYLQYQQLAIRQQSVNAAASSPEQQATIRDRFTHLREGETLLRTLSAEAEDWEKAGKGQILYTQEWAKPLNEVPYVLPATAFFKVFLVPLFAILLPVAMFFLPYFISRYMFGVNMSFDEYKQALGLIWSSGQWSLSGGSGWDQLRKLFQYGWFLFGIGQNIYQPIQQALHIRVIQKTMLQKGEILQQFFKEASALCSVLSIRDFSSEIPTDEPLRLYAYVREHPLLIQLLLRQVATAELNWALATCPNLCFVEYVGGTQPFCEIRTFCDPSISDGVMSDFKISSGSAHCIVTGPNKGGKSSSLRAILLNIWLAQTLGVAFADSMRLRPFEWIESGLRIADTPGQRSLFERELLFAKRVLERSQTGSVGFVVFDELFHSTNPPDGERTARLFLEELWKRPAICSLVSTHVFALVNTSPKQVQRLCVPAQVTETAINYSFHLSPGLCTVSSVGELYKEHGFPYSSPCV